MNSKKEDEIKLQQKINDFIKQENLENSKEEFKKVDENIVVFQGKVKENSVKHVKSKRIKRMFFYIGLFFLFTLVACLFLLLVPTIKKIKWLLWLLIPIDILGILVTVLNTLNYTKTPEKIKIRNGFMFFNDKETPSMEVYSIKKIYDEGSFYHADNDLIFEKDNIVVGDTEKFEGYFKDRIVRKKR